MNQLGKITPKIGGELLAERDGAVLLERRTDDECWGLPGGYMIPGESIEETIQRETSEELGVKPELDELIGVYTRFGDGEDVYGMISVVYTGTVSGEFNLDPVEVLDAQFQFPQDISNWHKDHGEITFDYFRKTHGPNNV